jgi:hypothetical protein
VNTELWAITADGGEKWRRGVDELIDASPVALADKSVCCISRLGLLLDLDPQRVMQWTYYVYGYGYACPAVSPSGKFYLSDRGVQFSSVPAGVPLAKSPWPRFRGNARNTGNIRDGER